jgi:tRNA pseudouridine38-40 synthase
MPRLRLTLAYTGGAFSGWQVQPALRTVQGCLEEALGRICQRTIRVHASGRTDAGVHALGQVAHCDVPEAKRTVPWRRALNGLLPGEMSLIEAAWVPSSFHARYSAQGKIYSYTLWTEPRFLLPQHRPYAWPVSPLDEEAMLQAAHRLEGRHDFASFQNVGTPVATTERCLFWIRVRQGSVPGQSIWYFAADGFLKQMARNLMSLLVDVGLHRTSLREAEAIFAAGDRSLAPATAPAKGLCLERVVYDEAELPLLEAALRRGEPILPWPD